MKKYSGRILIVDDEPLTRKSLSEILKHQGYDAFCAADADEAVLLTKEKNPDVVISDLKMPNITGIDVLRRVKMINDDIAVVIMTAYGSVDSAVEAMKEGAFDYITKPIVDSEIKIVIERIFEQKRIIEENKFLKKKLSQSTRSSFHMMIGQNKQMQKLYSLIETIAPTNASVLIQGESGTGKRLVAQAVHLSDPKRCDKPFIEVSCGALPENLLESELFGHVKGAFTSAIKDRKGRFEVAQGGTIFLDEIDTFSPKLQVKLLRVLQEGEFEQVGDVETIKVDVRVVAATNQDLQQLIKEGSFREDLYYRLNVIPINIPSLRERKDDIPLLVEHFLKVCSEKLNKKITDISQEAVDILSDHHWQGNVRELENVIERSIILCRTNCVQVEDLPEFLCENSKNNKDKNDAKDFVSLKDALKDSEKVIIEKTLRNFKGNRKQAAKKLGINRTTLYNKMKEYSMFDEFQDENVK